MAEAISEADSLAIIRGLVRKARKGDSVAAKLILDRLWPISRGHTIGASTVPEVRTVAGLLAAHTGLIRAVATGNLPTDAAQSM